MKYIFADVYCSQKLALLIPWSKGGKLKPTLVRGSKAGRENLAKAKRDEIDGCGSFPADRVPTYREPFALLTPRVVHAPDKEGW